MPAQRLTRENYNLLHPLAYKIAQGLSQGTLALPIELKFDTPQQAQHNRCRIYDFRRLLRTACAAATKSGNAQDMSLFDPLLSALESLESPRIDYNAKGPTTLKLRSRGTSPSELSALDQLAAMSTVVEPAAEAALQSPADLANLFEPEPEFDDIQRTIDGKLYTFRVPYGDNSSDKMLLMKSKLPNSGIIILDCIDVEAE